MAAAIAFCEAAIMASAVSSFCGSNVRSFKASAGLSRQQPVLRGVTAATMRKRDIHPEWYAEAKVFCNGVEVMTVGGTKETYNVDVYSGNHPFYQVSGGAIVVNSNCSSDMQVDTTAVLHLVGAAVLQQ